MVRKKELYTRRFGGKWYTSKFGDVDTIKECLQEKAKRLRKMGIKCVIVPDKRLGYRLFRM